MHVYLCDTRGLLKGAWGECGCDYSRDGCGCGLNTRNPGAATEGLALCFIVFGGFRIVEKPHIIANET